MYSFNAAIKYKDYRVSRIKWLVGITVNNEAICTWLENHRSGCDYKK